MQYQQVRQTAFGWICKIAMKKAIKDHQLQESKTVIVLITKREAAERILLPQVMRCQTKKTGNIPECGYHLARTILQDLDTPCIWHFDV